MVFSDRAPGPDPVIVVIDGEPTDHTATSNPSIDRTYHPAASVMPIPVTNRRGGPQVLAAQDEPDS
jgi:hypothetical protein